MIHLTSTGPWLGAGLQFALRKGLLRVGGLVIDVLDAWYSLALQG